MNSQLKSRPDLEPLRKALLKEPLEFFRKLRDQLKAESGTGPDAILSLAIANHSLASTTFEVGSVPDAIQSYSEAIALLEPLVRENPTFNMCQVQLARSQNNIGVLKRMTGKPGDALDAHNAAIKIEERLVREYPEVTLYQNDLASSYVNAGVLFSETNRPNEVRGL